MAMLCSTVTVTDRTLPEMITTITPTLIIEITTVIDNRTIIIIHTDRTMEQAIAVPEVSEAVPVVGAGAEVCRQEVEVADVTVKKFRQMA